MARSKSDISNHAIRIFLQMVGRYYDEKRDLQPFTKSKKNIEELLKSFNNECCFCNIPLNYNTISLDHLIPINKTNLGLNAWGNIVPSCRNCNDKKHNKPWEEFILNLEGVDQNKKFRNIERIKRYLIEKKYHPYLDLNEIANNLYNDIGAVAQTLIDLRYKQAELAINKIHKDNSLEDVGIPIIDQNLN